MTNKQFEHMLDQLLSSEASRVRNHEQLLAADRTISDLKTKISDLEWKIADLEWKLNQPKPAPQHGMLTAQSVADLMLGDRSKIQAIKVLRAISGMGLKEAKDMVEAASAEASMHRAAGTFPNRNPSYYPPSK